MPSDPRIRAAMDELTQSLSSRPSVDEALLTLTEGAVSAIPSVEYASISLRHPDNSIETIAPTAEIVELSDKSQYHFQQGPCFDSITDEQFLISEDIGADERWPEYGPVAAELGFGAQMAVRLADDRRGRSALNLYSTRPNAFDADDRYLAEEFASHAAVAMGFVNAIEGMRKGMDSRSTIGTAIGIVMERYQIDRTRAFHFLTRVSQTSNIRLRTVAEEVVLGLDGRTRDQHDALHSAPPDRH